MGRKKESKPLLSSTPEGQSSSQGTYIVRKIHKGRTVKPKLSSVSESETGGSRQGGKEMSKTKCLEKDVDETLQPGQTKKLEGTTTDGKTCSHSFGVRSYLHQFYDTVNNSNTSQVWDSYFDNIKIAMILCRAKPKINILRHTWMTDILSHIRFDSVHSV